MKKVIIVFGMLMISQVSLAQENTEMKCESSDGLDLTIVYKKNPRNGADAFVTLMGPRIHLGGWAFLKESSPESILSSSLFYNLEGNFPQGSILKVVEKLRTCGRGFCDYRSTIKTAKLISADEEVYFNCL
jgi:hypothetical protein